MSDSSTSTPQLTDLDLDALVGLPVEQARDAVERSGGTLRTIVPGGAMTMDYRTNRVTLTVVDGTVIESLGIG